VILYNTGYEVILAGVLGAAFAQSLKFIGFTIKNRKINFKSLTTTGGMPSAHSAGVVGLATSAGILSGFDSVIFAIAFGLALIVMYDAAGVRRAAGKIAATLNRVKDELYKHNTQAAGEKLKELLGHTPKEVFVGAVLGVIFAFVWHEVLFKLTLTLPLL